MTDRNRDGEISKQSVHPHSYISRDNDQLVHEPANANDGPLADSQESLGSEVRFTVRLPDGLKLEVTCNEEDLPTIGKALRAVEAEILRRADESVERAIEQGLQSDQSKSHFQFNVPGQQERLSLSADREQEQEVEEMFSSAGWTVFSIDRDA
jgi:hypothetical protein